MPFVGRGGQLLTKIIEACRLKREDVYILNMLKCRPPGNRNPLPHELANCRGYLERQLDLIRPEFICCLGAVASQNLAGHDRRDRQAAGQSPYVPRRESRVHLSSGVFAAQSFVQERNVGGHETVDARNGR